MLKQESPALFKVVCMTIVVGQANFLMGYCSSFVVYIKTNEDGSNIIWESVAGSLHLFTAIIGALMFGHTGDILGRKITTLLVFVSYFFGGLTLFLWDTNIAFFISIALTGIGIGGRPTLIMYASEVCNKNHRGTIISAFNVSSTLGMITTYTLQYYFPLTYVAVVLAVITLFSFFAMCWFPETKYWYAINGRMEEAKESSLWFDQSQSVEDVEKDVNKIRSSGMGTDDKTIFQILQQPVHLKKFLIALLLMALRTYSGRAPLLVFPNNFYAQFQTPYNTEKLSILQSYVNLVFCIVSTGIIEMFNRRSLLLRTSLVVSLLIILLIFADIFDEFIYKNIPWVTPLIILMYVGIISAILFPLITVTTLEIVSISNEKRNIMYNIIFIVSFFSRGTYIFLFPFLLRNLTVDGVLVIFLMSNVLIAPVVKFFVHETSNTELHSSAKISIRHLSDESQRVLLDNSDSDSEYNF